MTDRKPPTGPRGASEAGPGGGRAGKRPAGGQAGRRSARAPSRGRGGSKGVRGDLPDGTGLYRREPRREPRPAPPDRPEVLGIDAETVAVGLGCFSIGLGLAEVIGAKTLTRSMGMEDRAELVRGFGVREIVTGIGILSNPSSPSWLWARVGGDALDLAALVSGLTPENRRRGAVGVAIAAVAGVTLLDILCGRALSSRR